MSSKRPALPKRNQTRVYSKDPIRNQGALNCDEDYVETEFYADPETVHQPTQQQPAVAMTPCVSAPAVQSSKPAAKKGKGYLIVLGVVLLLCASVIAVIAVVLYRPTMTEDVKALTSQNQQLEGRIQDLTSKMEILERQFTAVQGFNYSLDKETLSALSSAQESTVNSIRMLNNTLTAVDRGQDSEIGQLNAAQSSTSSVLSTVQSSVTTLQNNFNTVQNSLNIVHNSLQTVSTVQGNMYDQLRTVDLYSGCTVESRACTIGTYSTSTYYWRTCATGYITVDPQSQDGNNYVTNIWCDITRSQYMEVFHIYRSGNLIRCECQVTRPSSSSSTHSTLTSYYFATCTLRVMKCPRSVNLLAPPNNSYVG